MDYYLISVIVFVGLLAALFYKDRQKIERHYGIVFMRRTQRGRRFIERVARSHPRLWAFLGDFGTATGVTAMVYGLYYLAKQALTPKVGPGLALLIPLPSAQGAQGAGYVGVPFWFFIIGISTLVIIHEGFHGIQVRLAKVPIKSMGLALLAVIPGAFVEPDDKALRRKSWRTQARVYAAGSFGNFLLAAVAGVLLAFVLSPVLSTGAIGFSGYVSADAQYPAQKIALPSPILSIDGTVVEKTEQLAALLATKKPGDTVMIETLGGLQAITLAANPNDPAKGFLGIAGVHSTRILKDIYRANPLGASALNFVLDAIAWIVTLNVGIGLVNMFPIKPLDGGRLMEVLARRFAPRFAAGVVRVSTALVLVLVALNLFGGLIF
ncbi:MAG: site-2 protease family protein [Candidatus Aenigmarchaeota archaeon]|nr:site-2 protease family protein [Candidatus Aenigmarchaeota archaeon]